MTNQEQKIIDYAKAHQRSRDFVGVFEENIEYVKLGGYVSESGKVVYLDHTADMMKNSVLYAGAPDVSDVPAEYKTEVIVCEEDSITAGKKLLDDGFCPVLLSFANRSTPGWGVWNGYPSQENGSLRRSDLFASIFQFDKENAKLAGIPVKPGNQYPMDKNTGGVYSPGVTFFRTDGRKGFQLLDEPYQLSVISMSAIYSPEIDENGRLTDLMVYGYTQKIRAMFRIALSNGHNAIVLGAWGCGDGGTPPEQLAEIFREILTEYEFRNKFFKVIFAVFMNDRALNAFKKTFGTRKNDLFINETGNSTKEKYDAGKYDFENLTGEQWSQLLCKHPEYADKCHWSELNSEDWSKLLAVQPQFAEHCTDWFYLLPQFAHICRWETFSGWKWAMLLVRFPELADKCDWKKLNSDDWCHLVYWQPQFKKNYYYKKTKAAEFIKAQWNGIWNSLWFMKHCIWLKIKPVILKKFLKMAVIIDIDILTGREWAELLYDHPELELICDWESFNEFDWVWILSKNPWYASKYNWSKAHWWHFGWDSLFQHQPSLLMKLPWSEIKNGYAWALRIAAHPEFAGQCDWELLDGYAWQKLLSQRPEFAHLCPWDKLNGLAWHYLIINRPQFADKCDWDKLDQDNWTELLLKNPAYADKCDWKKIKYDHLLKKLLRKYPQFTDNFDYSELNASAMVKLCLVQPLVFKHCRLENFSGRDWVDLLKNRPIFAEYCPWEKLYAEDWCLLLAVQPRFAEHFDFRGFLPWHWADLLARQPQFAELCPFWDKFYRDDWGKLIAGQPPFADRCDLSVLGRWDWVRILSSQPQFADKCPAWCWENFDGDRWSSLLINQPQFADRCDWKKLNGIDWKELLAVQPQFATHCNFSKLTPEHWQYLLWKQPHLADKCNWKKFKSRDWQELLASHPEYGKYCNWQKLTGEDWCWVLQSHPHFFKKCKWRKLNGSQWRFLLSHRPEFARFCNWKKLKPQDWQMLLEVRPEFAEKYQEYSSKAKFFCHFLQKIIPFNSRSKI